MMMSNMTPPSATTTSRGGGGGGVVDQQNHSSSSYLGDPKLHRMNEEDSSSWTNFSTVVTQQQTDDEVTLTSVRQIMNDGGGNGTPNNNNNNNLHPGSNNNSRSMRRTMNNTAETNSLLDSSSKRNILRSASSSSFDTDGGGSRQLYGDVVVESSSAPANDFLSRSRSSPRQQQSLQQQQQFPMTGATGATTTTGRPYRIDGDDTFDYGDRDDGGAGNGNDSNDSVEMKNRKKEAERKLERQRSNGFITGTKDPSPLINKDDVEHYRKSLDTPFVKTAAAVAATATIGSLILGPVGLLVGTAMVGIGVGVMQIPEEQRNNVKDKANEAFESAKEKAVDASEKLTTSCAATCHQAGVQEQVPNEVKACFNVPREMASNSLEAESYAAGGEGGTKGGGGGGADPSSDQPHHHHHHHRGARSGSKSQKKNSNQDSPHHPHHNHVHGPPGFIATEARAMSPGQISGRRVACLRNSRITPPSQIHGLDPSQQPRAWLDVMANLNTTDDEKMEAMEEIMILAKDKRHARFLLDDGILDSVMYILDKHFDKARMAATIVEDSSATNITPQEERRARLAANCCVTLGKAHCAAVHTEGDLLLMSLYERGSVPEERQLAQMLYEVPHHIAKVSMGKEVFFLQQASMPKAEELAASIKALADGKNPFPSS